MHDHMPSPGAARSTQPPQFEKLERRLLALVAATARTSSQAAGQVGASVPALPADATHTTPAAKAAFTSGWKIARAELSAVPKLRLTTATRRAVA